MCWGSKRNNQLIHTCFIKEMKNEVYTVRLHLCHLTQYVFGLLVGYLFIHAGMKVFQTQKIPAMVPSLVPSPTSHHSSSMFSGHLLLFIVLILNSKDCKNQIIRGDNKRDGAK